MHKHAEDTERTRPTAALGRALIVYFGASYALLEATDLFAGRLGMPDWTFNVVAAVLLAGLPVMLLTRWITRKRLDRAADKAGGAPVRASRIFTGRNAVTLGFGVFAVVGVVQVLTWGASAAFGPSESEWARGEGLALLEEYIATDDSVAGHATALRVIIALPDDTAAQRMAAVFAPLDTIVSEPSGVRVFRQTWKGIPDEPWEEIGRTPVIARRVPDRIRYRFLLAGHDEELIYGGRGGQEIAVTLHPEGSRAERMIDFPQRAGGTLFIQIPGYDHIDPPENLPDSRMGQFEVTNARFKEFVEAGAYTDPQYWQEPLKDGAEEVPFEEAMRRFSDQTGRPGPATWIAGGFPDGKAEHPVAGVSWFEAMAYARFRDRYVPTIWHWMRAANPYLTALQVPLANIGRNEGTLPVGASQSTSVFGGFDHAGNVREWIFNQEPETGERYIMGGGWSDPSYSFNGAEAHSPWDRSAINGIRLADYEDPAHPSVLEAMQPLPSAEIRDFRSEVPVSDEVFAVYRSMFEYDPMPLNAVVEMTDTTEGYVGERVMIDPAYDDDRLILYIYRPIDGIEPYQTVVVFPGSDVIYNRESSLDARPRSRQFLVKTGRALIFPVYKGTYERGGELDNDYPEETTRYREYVIQWVQDFNRALDYVDERPDLDGEKVAYLGHSWGGTLGGIVPAVAPRIKAVVLRVAGLTQQRSLPEVEAVNFLPRITQPVLMVNGQDDFFFPVEASQEPMFDLLGTPPALKRHVVFPGAHSVPQRLFIQEALDWLDLHLGPVGR